MLRRKKYHFKKPIFDATRAGQCDAVMGRPNDNPYREGSTEHATYEEAYKWAIDYLAAHPEPDETPQAVDDNTQHRKA